MCSVTTPPVPVVIVRPPTDLGPVELAVHHREWGEIEVDIRPAGSQQTWTPLQMMGGSFEVRAS